MAEVWDSDICCLSRFYPEGGIARCIAPIVTEFYVARRLATIFLRRHEIAPTRMVKEGRLGYDPAMSDAPPDFKALARRYLDLWQEQVAAVAADPALAEAVARGVAMMTQSAAAVAQATGLKVNQPDGGPKAENTSQQPGGPDGAASPGAAPHDPRLDPDELARRVTALEGRIARLEAALGGGGADPGAKPRRGRTRRLDSA
ncbi:hypothetical protein [Paramagnetospirillum magneticum]|uniref:hypothetical protein n=1 Tax=Paramagnetospirillum magneticum TaxID=84159 RepID=UPI0011D0848C|nr:hypothetical protein [Paramagnetospirillum magneticum]